MRRSAPLATARTGSDSAPRPEHGYQFPPLWGPDSYNDGAGMARLLDAAAFIKHNMPFGTTYAAPVLSDDDAYDVAGLHQQRASGRRGPISTRIFPTGCRSRSIPPYGPYADDFSAEQHKYRTVRADPRQAEGIEGAVHARRSLGCEQRAS